MIYITAVHMAPGSYGGHEHIESVQWRNPGTGKTGQSSRKETVDWINGGGDARVTDGIREVQVGVVNASPPYIRTYADGEYTDNLLSLPRY